jgi:hypothetical protein
MGAPSCSECRHGKTVFSSSWNGEKLRCMRLATYRDGTPDNTLGVGRDIGMERSDFAESHRVPGDKCGVEGRNFEVKT